MAGRLHVPFDALWAMPIDVPYSLLLRDGDLAWSCGQCPLDGDGRVLDPGDLEAQSRHVSRYVAEVLGRGGLSAQRIGKLVLYYVAHGKGGREGMLSAFREAFGEVPSLVPVAVPHFYYDGMMLEVDAFASAAVDPTRSRVVARGGLRIEVVDGGDLIWLSLAASPGQAASPLAEWPAAIDAAVAGSGASLDDLLAEHWYVPAAGPEDPALRTIADGLGIAGLAADPGAVVGVPGDGGEDILGELTFARGEGPVTRASTCHDGVERRIRRRGNLLWVSCRCKRAALDLVAQTRAVMPMIARALAGEGMGFGDVVKSTALYVGGSTPGELHANMAVRNRYYERPGPASTGLPVLALADEASGIAVDVMARRAAA